jgi:hypothetical protein
MMLDPRSEKSDLEQTAGSTGASSTPPEFEDEKKHVDNGSPGEEKRNIEAEGEYPEGIRLFFILVALVISMFLLSLDMVSATSSRNRCSTSLLIPIDNRGYSYSQNYRPISQSQRYRLVCIRLLYVSRRIPVSMGQDLQALPTEDKLPRGNIHL